MLWHKRPCGCGSWLAEKRGKCCGLWPPAFPRALVKKLTVFSSFSDLTLTTRFRLNIKKIIVSEASITDTHVHLHTIYRTVLDCKVFTVHIALYILSESEILNSTNDQNMVKGTYREFFFLGFVRLLRFWWKIFIKIEKNYEYMFLLKRLYIILRCSTG